MLGKYFLLVGGLAVVSISAIAYFALTRDPGANNTATTQSDTGVAGTVLLGPTCPVDQPGNVACDRHPYSAELVITANGHAQVVKEFSSDGEGAFFVAIAPGEYSIHSRSSGHRPYCSSGKIQVVQGKVTDITVYCDSGLR